MSPDEILLNEGRRNSALANKILGAYNSTSSTSSSSTSEEVGSASTSASSLRKPVSIKFISRSTFDQTKGGERGCLFELDWIGFNFNFNYNFTLTKSCASLGAGSAVLLETIARPSTYTPELIADEFIVLASSCAVLTYAQHSLGAVFAPLTVSLRLNCGELTKKMTIDPATVKNLEILANARNSKMTAKVSE